ncbi:unnamed protein product [Fusarium graminearum]|nr:unnamed protein product [Fusarium graminearum]
MLGSSSTFVLLLITWLCLIIQLGSAAEEAKHGLGQKLHQLTNPDSSEHCVDIVAVHGLDGHWKRSWTATNNAFWLQDLLPVEIPCARIFSYSHDSRTRGSETPLDWDISDHATALLTTLSTERRLTQTERNPILFIGHSLGGIILKAALLKAELARVGHLEHFKAIKLSTYAVVFLGTPHQGGEGIPLVEVLCRISSIVSHTNTKILSKMERNSEWLQGLQSDYNAISQDIETIFFYETLKMDIGMKNLLIVPKHSAIISGARNSEEIPLIADHSSMAKFSTSKDDGFQTLVKKLRIFIDVAKLKVSENWKDWEWRNGPRVIQKQQPKVDQNGKEFALGIVSSITRNPYFTGRDEILRSLNQKLSLPLHSRGLSLVVLYGSGGMGKTQIATEYVHRHHADYTSVFWIDGSRNSTASADILDCIEALQQHYEVQGLRNRPWYSHIKETLAKRVKETHSASLSDVSDQSLRKMFLKWLSYDGNCGWLMVIDNVDDLDSFDFRDWLPPTLCGSIIMTSRRKDLALHWNSIEVDGMTIDESMELLNKSSRAVPVSHSAQADIYIEYEVHQAFRVLVSYSFLKYRGVPNERIHYYSIHPLIHSWARHRMDIDKQKAFAQLTAAYLAIHSIDKIADSRRRNVIPDHLHVEHLLSIYEDLYPCTSHPSDIINIPARPQELAIGNTPPHYSIASFVEGCVLRLRGWMDEFYFFIKATYQPKQVHGHADYKILYSLHKKTRGLGADTMDWILCQALRSYPPKHPRMLEMIGHYFYSMSRNSGNSENSVIAGSWYQWLRLARFQVFGPRHPATTGKLDRVTVPKLYRKLPITDDVWHMRMSALGYDGITIRHELDELASSPYSLYYTKFLHQERLSAINKFVEKEGVENAKRLFGERTVLFYQMFAARDADVAPIQPTPPTWTLFLTMLEVFFDLFPFINKKTLVRWSRDVLDASYGLEKPPSSSHRERKAWLSAQPYLAGLHASLDMIPEFESSIYYPNPERIARMSNWLENDDWAPDAWDWRQLLPLARTAAKPSELSSDKSFLLSNEAEKDPSDQRPYFKWFHRVGPMLLEVRLSLVDGKANLYQCLYLNDSAAPQLQSFSFIFWKCTGQSYICEETFCHDRMAILLTLMGKLNIDGRSNLLDLRRGN